MRIQWIWKVQFPRSYRVYQITKNHEIDKLSYDSNYTLHDEWKYKFDSDTKEETQNETGAKEDYNDSSGESWDSFDVRYGAYLVIF